MKQIVTKWIFDCLGMTITPDNLGQELKDGVLLAKLLKHYGLVNDIAIKYIKTTDNPMTCENNLKQLNIWFQLLDIQVSKDTFFNIANGKTCSCIYLLYDLYTALHKKEKLFFMNTEYYLNFMRNQLKPCDDQSLSQPFRRVIKERSTLGDSFSTKRTSRLYSYVIKQKELREKKAKEVRPKVKIHPTAKRKMIENELTKVRNEDIEFVRNALTFSSFQTADSHTSKISPTIGVQSLTEEKKERSTRSQYQICSVYKGLTKDCENFIMNSVWKIIDDKENDMLKKHITQNLLQQSDYEKRVSSKKFQNKFQEKIDSEKFLEVEQKLEEESKNLGFFSSCKSSEEEINCQIDMIKRIDFHKKLYAEKLKKRYRKRYSICFQIINDIVDLAIKISHFGKESVGHDLRFRWKQMFISEQPIFENTEIGESNSAEIPLIEGEAESQQSDQRNFEEYLYLIGDWMGQAGSDLTFDDHYVLGNIIHRLFDIKNPPPFIQKPADIPKYTVSTILNGIIDESNLMKLKILLIKSKIILVDVNSAINFCIQRYKTEADIKDEIPTSKKGKTALNAKTSKQEDPKKNKKGPTNKENLKIDKEIQTASSLLSVTGDKELTNAAKIGKDLYSLETFDNISIPLKVEIIIEYLKSQPSIKGWVLVNFPCSLKEAYIIEKTLSGKKFPKKFRQLRSLNKSQVNSLNQQESKSTLDIWDDYKAKNSRLVQFPPNKSDNFVTYFKSFILVETEESEQNNGSTSRTKLSIANNDILSKRSSLPPEENEMKFLTAIYKEQGILHNFLYETMDLNTLKKLARLILNDSILTENAPSVEIFGEEISQFLAQTSDTKGKKSPKKSQDDPAEDYEILKQNLWLEEKQDESETESEEKIESESELEIKPGHKDWIYSEFYIPGDVAVQLANLWEEMETKYIKQATEIVSKRKQSQNLISPYIAYISQTMSMHFEENKEIQNTIKQFLENFNSLSKKKRAEAKTRDELRKGVFITEMKLWEITCKIKEEAEEKRKTLLAQNWTAVEMIEIVNSYVSLLQVEANRCISTIYILHNYYSIMSGGETKQFPFTLKPLQVQLNNENEKQKVVSAISKILADETNINMRNPIYPKMKGILQNLQIEINHLKLNVLTLIENYEKKIFRQLTDYRTKVKADKKKGKHKISLTDEDKISSSALVEAKYSDIKKMFLEWCYAVKSECDRTKSRIKLINRKFHADIDNLEKNMTTVFHNLKQKIKANYLKHNENVDKMCEVFHTAIIKNTPVHNVELYDKFFPLVPCNLFDVPSHSGHTTLEEEINSQCFTINQLKYISDRLKSVSPNFIINKNALQLIIEDLVSCEQERENILLFPKIWNDMSAHEFNKLFQTVCGLSDLVNWRDFIVYCLELRFPEMEDIVNFKTQFNLCDKNNVGFISNDDFMNTKLWFEGSIEDIENIQEIKRFLFSLFQVNENEMDYSKFILSFCKDFDQNVGFGKGLAYFSGHCIVVSDKELYLEDAIKEYNEQLKNMMKEILNQIIFDVVNTYAGLRIEEIRESTAEKLQHEIDSRKIKSDSTSSGISNEYKNETIIEEITYDTELKNETEVTEISTAKEDEIGKLEHDKGTQTISLLELLTDEYIKVNKNFRWTSKVPKTAINSLLEATVYPVLSSKLYKKETENIVCNLKRTISFLGDEYIYVPWLINQKVMHHLFSYVQCFKIFSLPSTIKGIAEDPCLFP